MTDNPLKNKTYNKIICIVVSLAGAFCTVLPGIIAAITNNLWSGLLIIPCTVQLFFVTMPVVATLQEYQRANSKRGLIHEKDIYALFKEDGTAKLHVGDIDTLPRYNVEIPETKVTMVPKEAFWIQDSDIWHETGEPTKRLLPTCTTCGKELGMQFFEDDTFKHCPGCGNRITLARIPNGWLEEFKAQEELRKKLKDKAE